MENKIRNKLTDLNDHLFCALERLGDEDLKGEQLDEEISRAMAIRSVAEQIVSTGNLVLKAKIAMGEHSLQSIPMLEG